MPNRKLLPPFISSAHPWTLATVDVVRCHLTPLAANRFADDPLLYTTPYCHVKKGYPNTGGVNKILSANRFAAKRFTWALCRQHRGWSLQGAQGGPLLRQGVLPPAAATSCWRTNTEACPITFDHFRSFLFCPVDGAIKYLENMTINEG